MSITYDVFDYVCRNPGCTKQQTIENVIGASTSIPVATMQYSFCRKCLECLQRFQRFKDDRYYQPLHTKTNWDSDKPSKQTLLVLAYFSSPDITYPEYLELVQGLGGSSNVTRQVYKDCQTISTILTQLDVLE